MAGLRTLIQNKKSQLKANYYTYRIQSTTDPYSIAFRSTPYKVIFILGHMRSASSLLVHLLNSNPEIIGYGESHIRYTSEQDLKKLLYKVYSRVGKLRMNHPYILDKLLHNSKLLNENLLLSKHIYKIFLIRNPQQTLPSILKIKPHWSQEKTVNHYIERLVTLERYAEQINSKERSLLITHDQLLNRTEDVFRSLQSFLEVDHPFSEQYQVLSTTGQRGVGDSSENIKQGKILRETSKVNDSSCSNWIKPSFVNYDRCFSVLCQYCKTTGDFSGI